METISRSSHRNSDLPLQKMILAAQMSQTAAVPLHCNTLYITSLHCTALHYTALYCTAIHYTALHCTALHCTIRHCSTALQYTVHHSNTLIYTIQHSTALQYTTHSTTLHCTAFSALYLNNHYLQCCTVQSIIFHILSLH